MFLHLHTISEKLRPVSVGSQPSVITKRSDIPAGQESKADFDDRAGEQRSAGRDPMPGPVSVSKGQLLGTIGTSGTSTGIHLHWQFEDGKDPYLVVFGDWPNTGLV